VSGYTDDGTGHNATPTSKRRAKRLDDSGESVWTYQWIAQNIMQAGIGGRTQAEAKAAYRAAGIQDSTYTGSRHTAHEKGLVAVRGDVERDGQQVYIHPTYANGRPIITSPPPNSGRARKTKAEADLEELRTEVAEYRAAWAALRDDLAHHLAHEGEPVEVHTVNGGWRDVIDYLPGGTND
jgi:hypothetical protein